MHFYYVYEEFCRQDEYWNTLLVYFTLIIPSANHVHRHIDIYSQVIIGNVTTFFLTSCMDPPKEKPLQPTFLARTEHKLAKFMFHKQFHVVTDKSKQRFKKLDSLSTNWNSEICGAFFIVYHCLAVLAILLLPVGNPPLLAFQQTPCISSISSLWPLCEIKRKKIATSNSYCLVTVSR